MYRSRSIQSSLSLRDKILSIDYILVISIFILGLISILAMYSTDGGEFKYHTNSHILRFFVFFGMFLMLSFIGIAEIAKSDFAEFILKKPFLICLILQIDSQYIFQNHHMVFRLQQRVLPLLLHHLSVCKEI